MALPDIEFSNLLISSVVYCFILFTLIRLTKFVTQFKKHKNMINLFFKTKNNVSDELVNYYNDSREKDIDDVVKLIISIAYLFTFFVVFSYLYTFIAVNNATHYSYRDMSGMDRLYYKGKNYISINPNDCSLGSVVYDTNKTISHIDCKNGSQVYINGIKVKK